MRVIRLFVVFAVWVSVSCGSDRKRPRAHVPDLSDIRRDVSVWVESDARMPKELIFKGCEAWKAREVFCFESASEDSADVRVYASDDKCVLNDNNGTPEDRSDDKLFTALALAYSGGDIKMMMGCLARAKGVYDSHQLSAVAIHEIGHQLGIWEHVPYKSACKDALTHPSGRKICGLAVMNRHYNAKIDYVTEIDSLAFDLRESEKSVLASHGPEESGPICVYH